MAEKIQTAEQDSSKEAPVRRHKTGYYWTTDQSGIVYTAPTQEELARKIQEATINL